MAPAADPTPNPVPERIFPYKSTISGSKTPSFPLNPNARQVIEKIDNLFIRASGEEGLSSILSESYQEAAFFQYIGRPH
jgi:hypothetical protein